MADEKDLQFQYSSLIFNSFKSDFGIKGWTELREVASQLLERRVELEIPDVAVLGITWMFGYANDYITGETK